jgi:hypothetical protein
MLQREPVTSQFTDRDFTIQEAALGTLGVVGGLSLLAGAATGRISSFVSDLSGIAKSAGARISSQFRAKAAERSLLPFVRGGLSDAEVAFAREIEGFRGGAFEGVPTRSAPGIDGFLDGIPISLKETQGGLSAVLKHASKAEAQALNAGYKGVDLYIRAPNVARQPLLDFAAKGGLAKIPTQGTIQSIHVYTSDGWVPVGR